MNRPYRTRANLGRYSIWYESYGNWCIVDWYKPDSRSICGYFVVRRFRNRDEARSYLAQMGDEHA